MKTVQIVPYKLSQKVTLQLPLSKSISNRHQILGFLSDSEVNVKISEADDSKILSYLLSKLRSESIIKDTQDNIFDTGDAGTAYRFMCALLSTLPGERILTGSSRMMERPVYPLVSVLNMLGAECHYLANEGYPPLRIIGKKLEGGVVNIESHISSQFISALMMVAPYMKKGLSINFLNDPVSFSYITLTAELMRKCGVKVNCNSKRVVIKRGKYSLSKDLSESDWSAASYWFSYVAICPESIEITLKGLSRNSFQGDSILPKIFMNFGVQSDWKENELTIKKNWKITSKLEINLRAHPDLFPAIAITTAALQIEGRFTGLESLVIKESNRLQAIMNELIKLGYNCSATNTFFEIKKGRRKPVSHCIETYNDHRIAMAFSILCLIEGKLTILNSETVNKSYPTFWRDLELLGININLCQDA